MSDCNRVNHSVNMITTTPSTSQYKVCLVIRNVMNSVSSGCRPMCVRSKERFEAFLADALRAVVGFFLAGALVVVGFFFVAIAVVYTACAYARHYLQ